MEKEPSGQETSLASVKWGGACQVLLRHFTTFVIILGALWWLAVPRVEAFINSAVDIRIMRIESQLDAMQRQLTEISRKLDERK